MLNGRSGGSAAWACAVVAAPSAKIGEASAMSLPFMTSAFLLFSELQGGLDVREHMRARLETPAFRGLHVSIFIAALRLYLRRNVIHAKRNQLAAPGRAGRR